MSTPHALSALLRVKQRRLDQLNEEAARQQTHLRACEHKHAMAEQAWQACESHQAACAEEIERLAREAFRPSDRVMLQHVLDRLSDKTRMAAQIARHTAQGVEAAQQQLALARQAGQRAQRQLDLLAERRHALLREQAQADEDAQDEEAEEAAVARRSGPAQQLASADGGHA